MTPGALGADAGAFVLLAARVFRHAASEARRTRGAFEGSAAPVLAVAVAMAEAGRSAFQALAADPALSAEDRVGAMQIAGRFAEAAGAIATRFGASAQLTTTDALRSDAKGGSVGLATALAPEVGPVVVSIGSGAQAALDGLRQDPLALATDLATVRLLMAAAVAGIGVSA